MTICFIIVYMMNYKPIHITYGALELITLANKFSFFICKSNIITK